MSFLGNRDTIGPMLPSRANLLSGRPSSPIAPEHDAQPSTGVSMVAEVAGFGPVGGRNRGSDLLNNPAERRVFLLAGWTLALVAALQAFACHPTPAPSPQVALASSSTSTSPAASPGTDKAVNQTKFRQHEAFSAQFLALEQNLVADFWRCLFGPDGNGYRFTTEEFLKAALKAELFSNPTGFSEAVRSDCAAKALRVAEQVSKLEAPTEYRETLDQYGKSVTALARGWNEWVAEAPKQVERQKQVKKLAGAGEEWSITENPNKSSPGAWQYDRFLHCAVPDIDKLADGQALLELLARKCIRSPRRGWEPDLEFLSRLRDSCIPALQDPQAKAPPTFKLTFNKFAADYDRQAQAWGSCFRRMNRETQGSDPTTLMKGWAGWITAAAQIRELNKHALCDAGAELLCRNNDVPGTASPPAAASSASLSPEDFSAILSARRTRDESVLRIPKTAVGSGRLGRKLIVGINTRAAHIPGIAANLGLSSGKIGSIYQSRYGIEVDFKLLEGPEAKLAAFVAGDIDVMWDTVDGWAREASVLAGRGQHGKAVLLQGFSQGGDGIVSLENITSIADLRGKTIALTRFGASHWLLLYLLTQSGLTEAEKASVEKHLLFSSEAPLAAAAFKTKTVDAAITWEPDLTGGIRGRAEAAHLLATTAAIPNLIADCLVARADLVEKAPATLLAFLHGWFDGIDLVRREPKLTGEIIGHAFSVNQADVTNMLTGVQLTDFADNALFFGLDGKGSQFESLFGTASTVWLKLGALKRPVTAKEGVDTSFLAALADSYPGQKANLPAP